MLVKTQKPQTHKNDAGEYIDPPRLSKPDKTGIMVISEMPTRRIVAFMAKKHRVGLLVLGNLLQAYLYMHTPIMHVYRAFFG